MKRLFVFAVMFVALSGFAGCYNHVYQTGEPLASSEPQYNKWAHHLIGGLITLSDDVYLKQVCPSGVAKIEDYHSFVNMLVSGLTGGIYAPTTVKIWCKGASAAVEVPIQLNDEISQRLLQEYPELPALLQAELQNNPVIAK